MIHVVGGCYREYCLEPHWDELYGPGGRAAAALSGRGEQIELTTLVSDVEVPYIKMLAKSYGFTVNALKRNLPVSFRYRNMLARPIIEPKQDALISQKDSSVISEFIIKYGFYEPDISIKGKYVVYDPQNGSHSRHLEESGSSAEHLALVCNYGEGRKLSGKVDPNEIVDVLLSIGNIEVVILKGAWRGALAATKTHRALIKPLPTNRVFKIGSGDVFSATFAWAWGINKMYGIDAASYASQQTAWYCENGVLPIPVDAQMPVSLVPKISANLRYDVYLAGPFFYSGQLAVIEEIKQHLEDAGLKVFSPFHDAGMGQAKDICQQDLEALKNSSMILAVLNGFDPGTIFEVGYARALEIPVLIYCCSIGDLNSTMFVGSDCEIVTDLATSIYRAHWWINQK